MKIAIVEDEKALAIDVMEKLHALGEPQVFLFDSGEQFLFECESNSFDLVILDIQMRRLNGLETAKKLRERDSQVALVFLTNDPSFVFAGYEVDAIRYWLKPVDYKKLKEVLELVQIPKKYIVWNVEGELIKLYEEDIFYVESDAHYVLAHHKTGVFRRKANFREECEKLSQDFQICHRSFCINMNHVNALCKDGCKLDNQVIVPVSRAYKKEIQDLIMERCKEDLLCNF